MFHVHLRRLCILLLDKVVYKCQSGQVSWECCSSHYILAGFLTTWFLSIIEWGILKSSATSVDLLLLEVLFQFCFMYFEDHLKMPKHLGLLYLIAFTNSFYHYYINRFFFFLVIFLARKVILYDINTAFFEEYKVYLSPIFHFKSFLWFYIYSVFISSMWLDLAF